MPVTNYLCVVRVSFSRCRPEKLTRPPGGVAPRRGLTGGQAALPCALPLRSRRMGEVALGSRWAGGWQRHPRPSSQEVQPHAPSSLRVRRVLRRRRIIRELRHRRPGLRLRRRLDPHQPHGRVRGGGSVGHAKASWCRNGRYDPVTPQWSLASAADANVVSLDPSTGRITGRRAGTATVVATSDGLQGASLSVTVR